MIKVCALFFAPVFLSMATENAKDTDYGYAVVVDGAVAMKKLPLGDENLYPWVKTSKDDIRSHSCGFARITYQEVNSVFLGTGRYTRLRDITFYYQMGEWCEVAQALLEPSRSKHVIAYRKWGRKKYILAHARVYTDNEGVPYIADKRFVEDWGLESLVTPIAQGADNRGCFVPTQVPGDLLDPPSSMVVDHVGYRCATKGVKLRQFVLPANNSLQRP